MYHLLVQFVSNTCTTCVVFSNYPVNMPDPEAIWLWPACGQNWAWCYMPDPTSHIRFSSVFPKKALIILCKTDPDLIWMAQRGFGQTLVSRNHWAHFLAGCNWLAASFPLSDLVVFFHLCPRSRCAKWAQIQFSSGWLCLILAKGIWSISKPVCKNHPAYFWPMLLSQSRSDVSQIWHNYWLLVLSLQFSVPTPSVQFAVPALAIASGVI